MNGGGNKIETCQYCGWAITEVRYNKQVIWQDQWFAEQCGWDGNNSPHIPSKLNQQETRRTK